MVCFKKSSCIVDCSNGHNEALFLKMSSTVTLYGYKAEKTLGPTGKIVKISFIFSILPTDVLAPPLSSINHNYTGLNNLNETRITGKR